MKKLIFLIIAYCLLFNSNSSFCQWQITSCPYTASSYDDCIAISGTNIFVGDWGEGVYLSTDDGARWNIVNNGLTDTSVYSLINRGNDILAGTADGVFLTTDNGLSRKAINNGIENFDIVEIIPNKVFR